MTVSLPEAGSADAELQQYATQCWWEAAAATGIDTDGLDPLADLQAQILWARRKGLSIGAVYARYSSKMQHSVGDQIRECLEFAARDKIFVPVQLISCDRAGKGRRVRRDGLDRLKAIIENKIPDAVLVYKASRLFRQAYRGYQFFQEQIVEEGLRGVSVSQGIDTAEEKAWKLQLMVHGLLDESLLDTIADHVRTGLTGTFLNGHVCGALPVGFSRKEVPDARPTNRGLPRTEPEINPEVAKLIVKHFEWIRDSMPICEGCRRWNEEGGPCDPRATTGYMTVTAYRRLLCNPVYCGQWSFGKKRNKWFSKKDGIRQIEQPESGYKTVQREHLRIVSDELFLAVQERLANGKRGRHKWRRREGPLKLWDVTTGLFECGHCGHRLIQGGSNGIAMSCPAPKCPTKEVGAANGYVQREEAVKAVCAKLGELIMSDDTLVQEIVSLAQGIDARREDLAAQVAEADRNVVRLKRKIKFVIEAATNMPESSHGELMAEVKAAQHELAAWQLQLSQAKSALDKPKSVITPDHVRVILSEFGDLLNNAVEGKLGGDVIYTAAQVLEDLVGGKIIVRFERRPSRKRCVVRGAFRPCLLHTVAKRLDVTALASGPSAEVLVWLRKPPRIDLIADEVKRLYDDEGVGFREIGDRLGCGSGNACLSYKRWHEMNGLPLPPRRTNTGRPRKMD